MGGQPPMPGMPGMPGLPQMSTGGGPMGNAGMLGGMSAQQMGEMMNNPMVQSMLNNPQFMEQMV